METVLLIFARKHLCSKCLILPAEFLQAYHSPIESTKKKAENKDSLCCNRGGKLLAGQPGHFSFPLPMNVKPQSLSVNINNVSSRYPSISQVRVSYQENEQMNCNYH